MKRKICKSIICTLLIISCLIGSVHCFAKSYTADEVNTRIGGIVAYRSSSYGVKGEQGIVNYYAANEMTLGGEWYVLSFIQNNAGLDYSVYSKKLISYLKNNEVYSASSREKFALILLALNSSDSFAEKYISNTANEAIDKQGIMSLIFGLHLLNNGCKSSLYTTASLVNKILSLQKSDGGWANSGDKSDVDVTAMTLEALYPYRSLYSSQINKAIDLLSSRQSENGDFLSYGVYNAESTAQVIIALSSLGIDASKDSRFVKNGNSVLDGLERYRNSDGSYSHKAGEGANNSATFQALNALVAFSRFINGKGAFYKIEVLPKENTSNANTTLSSGETEKTNQKSGSDSKDNAESSTTASVGNTEMLSTTNKTSEQTTENKTDVSQTGLNNESTESNLSVGENTIVDTTNKTSQSFVESISDGKIKLTKELKIKLIISSVILLAAIICSVILFVLKKRNKKNFIVIIIAAAILITSIFFIRIQGADDYYNSASTKESAKGVVTLTVRCDTIMGKQGAPDNPVILEKTEYSISEGDTVYIILAQALRENGILFEHNASFYISGIDNLYEFQFGELSGWMYRVNGETPSVGCGEYVLNDGDEIEWLYTCDIGNDLK